MLLAESNWLREEVKRDDAVSDCIRALYAQQVACSHAEVCRSY